MRETGLSFSVPRSPACSLEGWHGLLWLRLAVWRQRPLPRLCTQTAVRQRTAGREDYVPLHQPDRISLTEWEAKSFLFQRYVFKKRSWQKNKIKNKNSNFTIQRRNHSFMFITIANFTKNSSWLMWFQIYQQDF